MSAVPTCEIGAGWITEDGVTDAAERQLVLDVRDEGAGRCEHHGTPCTDRRPGLALRRATFEVPCGDTPEEECPRDVPVTLRDGWYTLELVCVFEDVAEIRGVRTAFYRAEVRP